MSSHTPYILVSAFDILALATVIGALACRLWIVPKIALGAFHGRLWRLLRGGLTALTLSSIILLIGRTLEMSGQPINTLGHWLPLVIKETSFGHIWLFRVAMLFVIWIAWLMGRSRTHSSWAPSIMLLAIAGVAFTRSATGHPADQGQWMAPEWVDVVHLMAGSVWAGCLLAMTVAVFPYLSTPAIPSETRIMLVKNLSKVATIALATILVTGILASFHYLGSWHALWYSSYGHILLVKLSFVLIAIMLGATNRFLFVPRILAEADSNKRDGIAIKTAKGHSPLHALARSVALETLFLGATLVAAAVLLHGMPPREMAHAMGGTMARTRKASPMPLPRFEDATWTAIIRKHPRTRPVSGVRYGVLNVRAADPFSQGQRLFPPQSLAL